MARRRDPGELSTFVRASPESAAIVRSRFTVAVIGGPNDGARLELDANRATPALVGTSALSDLRVDDRMVSRRHASLEVTGRGLRIADLGSRNGVFVGGLAVGEAFLTGGETVTLGQTSFRVDSESLAAPAPLPPAHRFGRLVGASEAMRRLFPLCERLATSDVPVLIEGETGTGKEVLAEALHEQSARAAGPFCVFDCAAVSPSLVESALFGHVRGSFTGAAGDRRGIFEEASGGTLLIDELGELDPSVQPKLLRVLERGEVQRVGSNAWIKVDVRVIAATRRDLDREVQAGRFRDDLFYRLAVGRIELPPLRRREGDVTVLALQFWRALSDGSSELPATVIARFEDYAWPGNVRELRNAVARYASLGEVIDPSPSVEATSKRGASHVHGAPSSRPQDAIDAVVAARMPFVRARDRVVAEFERRYVEDVLARYGGQVARAAAASGIARRYFQLIRARTRDGGSEP